jgi:hypothetical protein
MSVLKALQSLCCMFLIVPTLNKKIDFDFDFRIPEIGRLSKFDIQVFM